MFRFNLNNIDLNRDFPDYLNARLPSPVHAIETNAVIAWLRAVPFVLSANFHGGALVVSVPYDRYCNRTANSFQIFEIIHFRCRRKCY